ncbi:MAG TPA: prepilin-type N-terminal cleavage/methylation domain-containing protein [Candidatus Xenobia bacterium]|jgi:prepilin-type N-terminal cleavage/methylation domain-containing protein
MLRYLRAFTLIEVMVTMAILATLLAIALHAWRAQLAQRQTDTDYKLLSALLLTARDQAKTMGSGQGTIQTGAGASPVVYVSFAPWDSNAGQTIVVYYQALSAGGVASTAPLEQMTLAPNDGTATLSPAPSASLIAYSPAPSATTGGALLSSYTGGNATPVVGSTITVTVQGGALNTPTVPHSFVWDTNTGGVTLTQ